MGAAPGGPRILARGRRAVLTPASLCIPSLATPPLPLALGVLACCIARSLSLSLSSLLGLRWYALSLPPCRSLLLLLPGKTPWPSSCAHSHTPWPIPHGTHVCCAS